MVFVIDDESRSGSPSEAVTIDAFNEKVQAAGQWIAAGGLVSPTEATVIDNRNDLGSAIPGSLFEGKDFYSGFWLLKADSIEEAIDLAHQGSRACNRKVELRPLL